MLLKKILSIQLLKVIKAYFIIKYIGKEITIYWIYWKKESYEQIAADRITFNLLLYESSFLRTCRILAVLLSKSSLSEIIRNLDTLEIQLLDLPNLAVLKTYGYYICFSFHYDMCNKYK